MRISIGSPRFAGRIAIILFSCLSTVFASSGGDYEKAFIVQLGAACRKSALASPTRSRDTPKKPVSPFEDPERVSSPAARSPLSSPAGTLGSTINVPADYATIQAAITAAISGDVILVAAGVYAEAITIDNKSLTIQGAGAGSSIISGTIAVTDFIVKITNGAVVDISGFTVDGTGKTVMYGVWATAGTDGNIHDNEIKNVSSPGAIGLAVRRADSQIDVIDNAVYGFGRIGIYTRDDAILNTDGGVISGNTVTGLGGSDPDRLSYGISVYSGNPTVDDNEISGCVSGTNVAAWASSAIDIWNGATAALTNNDIHDSDYGIISCSASPTISGNTFTDVGEDVRLDFIVKSNPVASPYEYYNTIQAAIDAIPSTSYLCLVWIGIYGGGGAYNEAVNVNKPCEVYGNSRATVTINPVGYAVNNAGVYVGADNVELYSFTLIGSTTNSLPRYGVKFGNYDGCVLWDAEIRNLYRTGVDVLGATNLTIIDVYSHDNGGNGLQATDARDVTFENITTSGNAWGGVGIFTYGQYTPIGTSGIVFTGTNSFGETGSSVGSIYLEMGNYATPSSPYPITYSTDILDGADVTVQLADVTHTLHGISDNSNRYARFYRTLGDAQTAAAGAVSHILGGRYIMELAGTDLYVPSYLGGIQPAVIAASSGNVIHVDAGSFATAAQVVVNKNLTIVGAGSGLTTITTSFNTGSSGDARGWFLVPAGYDFDLDGVTLDGAGQLVYQAIRNFGTGGSAHDVVFRNIKYNESGPNYMGVAIAAGGTGPLNVTDCAFSEIGRVGVLYYGSGVSGSSFTGNTYTGKGPGNWLDYGLEVSAGAAVTVDNCAMSGCSGVALVDGSTSAAIMATDKFGPGTAATITNCDLTNNTTGIAVGYGTSDASAVVAHGNAIYGNLEYGFRARTRPWMRSATGGEPNPGPTTRR